MVYEYENCLVTYCKVQRDVTYDQVWWPILRICALHLTHPRCTHTHTHGDTHTCVSVSGGLQSDRAPSFNEGADRRFRWRTDSGGVRFGHCMRGVSSWQSALQRTGNQEMHTLHLSCKCLLTVSCQCNKHLYIYRKHSSYLNLSDLPNSHNEERSGPC